MKLKPQLVIVSGVAATGKSSTLAHVAREVDNLFLLEKDLVNQGSLYVHEREVSGLLPFQKYVEGDGVFPNNAHKVETAFGNMWQVNPTNDFYGRHARDQSYIVMGNIAASNLSVGKVPVIDCFVNRQIDDGVLGKFMEQEMFEEYRKKVIHFTCSEDECYRRRIERSKRDSHAKVRDAESISSRAAFHEFITNKQPLNPRGLQNYEHLLLDTTDKSPKDCAREAIEYLVQEN